MMNTMIITATDIRRTWPADADRAISCDKSKMYFKYVTNLGY